MLVLARQTGERILLPDTGVSIKVIGIRSGGVRLGIDAPPKVRVVRDELWDGPWPPERSAARERDHAIRNRLSGAMVGLGLLRRQIQAGLIAGAEATLQRVRDEVESIREHLSAADTPPARAPAPRCRALLVEDDHNERELLCGFLRLAGLEVEAVGDGADALAYLRDGGRADVVLLDMVLPRCDGPTTVRAIRDDPGLANVMIYGVTGHDPERFDIVNRVDRWFRKPLNPEELLEQLRPAGPVREPN